VPTKEQSAMTAIARELAHRTHDGIDVTLMWHPAEDRVTVAVIDIKAGEAFELVVPQGERALDVFEHPFAYAALRSAQVRRDDTDLALSGSA
jgi:hypothetical protein